MQSGEREAVVVSNDRETEQVNRLVIAPEPSWTHGPGQVARLSLGGDCEGTFAIASPPGAATLTFLIKAHGTSAEPLMGLARGQRVGLAGPFGAGFALPAPGPRLVFAAAGTAIAAAHAGLFAALAAGHAPADVAALIGVRHLRELPLRDGLATARARGVDVRVVVSRPEPDARPTLLWGGHAGRVQAHLDGMLSAASWVFIAGSDAFEDDLERALAAVGVELAHVQRNYRSDRRGIV